MHEHAALNFFPRRPAICSKTAAKRSNCGDANRNGIWFGRRCPQPGCRKKVFEAKGRPADNPLIVHIAALEQLSQAAKEIPPLAYALAEAFWPGPLTMIFQSKRKFP